MSDAVIQFAGDYAAHTVVCRTCSDCTKEMCREGVRLMQAFHAAMDHMLNQKYTDA